MLLPKVVFLDRATIPDHIQVPRPSFEHEWVEYGLTPQIKLLNDLLMLILSSAIKSFLISKC